MTRQLIHSERLHRDVPYHYAAAATGEMLVFTAGACPLDGNGRVVAPGPISSSKRARRLRTSGSPSHEADCQPGDVLQDDHLRCILVTGRPAPGME